MFLFPVSSLTGEGNQSSSTGASSYLDGFAPVKSIGSMSASYLLVPSPSMRYLSPATLQLPTCLTSESPPLAHLLHSKGTATPLAMGYVVSKAVPPVRKNAAQLTKEDRHSVLSVSIVDYYGGSTPTVQEKMSRGVGGSTMSKQAEEHIYRGVLLLTGSNMSRGATGGGSATCTRAGPLGA